MLVKLCADPGAIGCPDAVGAVDVMQVSLGVGATPSHTDGVSVTVPRMADELPPRPTNLSSGPSVPSWRDRLVGRLPWWALVALGVAGVGVGGWLLARPFRSLHVLVWLAGAGLVINGVAEVAAAGRSRRPGLGRAIGVLWVGAGVAVMAWPSITLFALALATGVVLVLGGTIKLVVAARGSADDVEDDRFLVGLSGVTNVISGVLALTWPGATVLVLALVIGLRTAIAGVDHVIVGVRRRSQPGGALPRRVWPRWVRVTAGVAALGLALAGLGVSVALHRATPDDPGPFYTAPSPLPDVPLGTILRQEEIAGFHPDATSYRVLYMSTGFDGSPTAVSGLVVVPDAPAPADGRKIVAFTHGTVGVQPNCAPSALGTEAVAAFEGLDEFVAAGYVVAATDYQGLGTQGPHPYLVGDAEAMQALDSVRAAQELPEAEAGNDVVVWGHSQGGHASLFTGEVAPSYAPELNLLGIAAGAPVPDLVELFKYNVDTTVGKVLISMALSQWAEVFDASLSDILTPAARLAVDRVADVCLYGLGQIASAIPGTVILDITFLKAPPWEVEPWRSIVSQNNPGGRPTGVPMFVSQGDADTIVDPALTATMVDRLCEAGETVQFHEMVGVGHVEAGHEAAPTVAEWMADRFAGSPAPSTCP